MNNVINHNEEEIILLEREWFPGHMAKALKNIRRYLKTVDILLEVRDARAPFASANPEISKIAQNKKCIILCNKADLISKQAKATWEKKNSNMLFISANNRNDIKRIIQAAYDLTNSKRVRFQEKGINAPPIRMMLVGLPNTGKSTLINRITNRKATKVANQPGITRSPSWVLLANKQVELLDMPGIMPPSKMNYKQACILVALRILKEAIIPLRDISDIILQMYLQKPTVEYLARYQITKSNQPQELDLLYVHIGKLYSMYKKGNEIDLERVYQRISSDFQQGKLGGIVLEDIFK